ncbi:Ankyrin repeat and BTB/POZ domain-containing protein 1 [Elasticomyces elasticus]|nr:Ankyrin repeat and BTB/POZ domain-containing protein 1 [Elasticomyces elasticus]
MDDRQRYNAIIRILAGEGRESISVHKDVLCRNSDFFVKACSKAWMQEEEDKYFTDGIVTVETVDLTTMDLYIHWKYYGKIDISRIHAVRGPETKSDRSNISEVEALLKLYVAGKYFFESSRLSNQVISELAIRVERWRNGSPFTGGSLIDYVWDNTASGDTLRSFILDSCSASATMESFLVSSRYPQEFYQDVISRRIELRGLEPSVRVPGIKTHCLYHEHKGERAAEEKVECRKWAEEQMLAGKKRTCDENRRARELPVKEVGNRAPQPVFPQPGWSMVQQQWIQLCRDQMMASGTIPTSE